MSRVSGTSPAPARDAGENKQAPPGTGPARTVHNTKRSTHVISSKDILIERLFEAVIAGDRPAARRIVEETLRQGSPPEQLVTDLYWPVYERVQKLHRADQLTTLANHMATRLLRMLVDQAAAGFARQLDRGRTVFACCGPSDSDELGAQMAIDLLEADGYHLTFAGGGIANDEILAQVQESRPDVLLLFSSAPGDLPNIRALIDTMREIGACSKVQIVVGGGVFNRAEGLAEEIGADLWATTPRELLSAMSENPDRRADEEQRTVGRGKRKRAAA